MGFNRWHSIPSKIPCGNWRIFAKWKWKCKRWNVRNVNEIYDVIEMCSHKYLNNFPFVWSPFIRFAIRRSEVKRTVAHTFQFIENGVDSLCLFLRNHFLLWSHRMREMIIYFDSLFANDKRQIFCCCVFFEWKFMIFVVNDQRHFHRSIDGASTWVRMNNNIISK